MSGKKELKESLIYYNRFIENGEFDAVLREATVLLGVLNVEFQDRFNKEIYGQTKDTGIEAHAIAYSKPLIVNSVVKLIWITARGELFTIA